MWAYVKFLLFFSVCAIAIAFFVGFGLVAILVLILIVTVLRLVFWVKYHVQGQSRQDSSHDRVIDVEYEILSDDARDKEDKK